MFLSEDVHQMILATHCHVAQHLDQATNLAHPSHNAPRSENERLRAM